MAMYSDFEATTPTNNCFHSEQKKMFVMSSESCWSVTKIYAHYIFEQECFRKKLILMNQRSRHNAKKSIEKDSYKLMNNSNFGYDCCKQQFR